MNNLIKYSLLAFLCINFSANGQNLKKIYTEVRNENMDNLLIELNDIKKDKNYNSKKTALFQIATCILYASEKSPIFNPIESNNLFKNIIITGSDRESIFDFLKDYNLDLFKVSDLIYRGIYVEAKTNNTEDSYIKALEACGLCGYSEQIVLSQTELAYNNAKSRNNIQDYKGFLDRYRDSKYDTEIKELIVEIEFENAKKSGNIELLNSFISIYPSHKLTNSAVELRDKLALPSENATIKELSAYIAKYPLSKYVPAVLERIEILEKQKKAIKNDLTEEGLKGNVLSLTSSNFFEGDTNERSRLTKFNTDGYKIYIEDNSSFGYQDTESEKFQIFRDTNNNKIEEKEIHCRRKSGEAEKNYIWNTKYYYDGNSVTKKTSTMDEHDKVVSADDGIIKYIYDEKGRLISETQSQRILNEPYSTFINKYNKYENDLLVEEVVSNSKYFHKYDENKKLIFTQSMYDDGGFNNFKCNTTYKYNNKGLLIEKRGKLDSGKTTLTTYYYDENDMLIKEKHIGTLGLEEFTTYEYDEIGNWIKQILKCEGKKTYTINRMIEYYSNND